MWCMCVQPYLIETRWKLQLSTNMVTNIEQFVFKSFIWFKNSKSNVKMLDLESWVLGKFEQNCNYLIL